MSTTAQALQLVANAVAAVLDADADIATQTGHASPQCVRLGSNLDGLALPILLHQATSAREIGGLLGTYLVSVELYAIAMSPTDASDLLAAAQSAITGLALAAQSLDAIPDGSEPTDADPLDFDDVDARFPGAFGVSCALTLQVHVP